jgi:AcrR family transcriptional regulator
MMKKAKPDNPEKQILDAADNIFHTKGLNGARMQEIADKAGINKAMLHYYYRSKQLLFEAVFENAFSLLAPQLNAILNDDSSIEEKVRNFTHNYITFISKHPYLPNFVIQELNRNPDFIEKIQESKLSNNRPSLEIKTIGKSLVCVTDTVDERDQWLKQLYENSRIVGGQYIGGLIR